MKGYTDKPTTELTDAELPQWLEFLQSVMASEVFVFDPWGTVANPVEQQAVTLQGGYNLSRLSTIGWQIGFRVVKV